LWTNSKKLSSSRNGFKVRIKGVGEAKPESTINNAAEPITITRKVMKLMMFTAF